MIADGFLLSRSTIIYQGLVVISGVYDVVPDIVPETAFIRPNFYTNTSVKSSQNVFTFFY